MDGNPANDSSGDREFPIASMNFSTPQTHSIPPEWAISLQNNIRATKACSTIDARELFRDIKEGKWRVQIDRLRALPPAQGREAKRDLPAVIFAGVFGAPKNEGLRQHSGLMVLDFDDVNEQLTELRAKAQFHTSVVATFVSPSGKGLKVVVRVRPSLSALEHSNLHKRIAAHLSGSWGFQIDGGPDASRRCFVSCDPDLYLNKSATAWEESGTADLLNESPLNRDTEVLSHRATELPRHSATHVVSLESAPLADQWVKSIQTFELVPVAEHQTNHALFELNRLAMSFERELERSLTRLEREGLFDVWYNMTVARDPGFVWRARGEYWLEFQAKRDGTKVPIDEDGLENAVEAAKSAPPPPVDLGRYEDSTNVMLTIAICYQLWLRQKATQGCFFLSCRSLARYLNGVSYVTCSLYLKGLVEDGILVIADEEALKAQAQRNWKFLEDGAVDEVRTPRMKARRYRWVEEEPSKANQGQEQIGRRLEDTAILTE